MVGKLGYEKGFAHLGSAHKEVCPGVEQALYHWGPAGVHLLVEVAHGNGGQIGRVADPAQLPHNLRQIFLRGVVFVKILCYTFFGYF